MRSPLVLATILSAVIGVSLIAVNGAFGPERTAYIEGNERLMHFIPSYPEAELVELDHFPYYQERGFLSDIPVGWTTNAIYRPPQELSAGDILSFYTERMTPSWAYRVDEVPSVDLVTGQTIGRLHHVAFTRGIAYVGLNLDNMYDAMPRTYEVVFDYSGLRKR